MQQAPLPESLTLTQPKRTLWAAFALLLLASALAAWEVMQRSLAWGGAAFLLFTLAAVAAWPEVRRSARISSISLFKDGLGRAEFDGELLGDAAGIQWSKPFWLPGSALLRLRASQSGKNFLFIAWGAEQIRVLSIFSLQVTKQAHASTLAEHQSGAA
jgi:hypothetical protein